ncbi:MAG: hypothetical protein ACOY3L_05855 [Pseudomonadota bacterium]
MGRLLLVALWLVAAFIWPGAASAAQTPAEPGRSAILEIEIAIEGTHAGKINSTDSTEWRVMRRLETSYELQAQPLQKFGMSDPAHQAEVEAGAAALNAQGAQVATDNAALMQEMQQAVEACGDDEACIQNLVMRMAQQPGMQGQLQAMGQGVGALAASAQAFDAASPPRYQPWRPAGNSAAPLGGDVKLEEWRKDVVYDPLCYQTDNICTSTRSRKGSHAIDAADPGAIGAPVVEVDTAKDLISVMLTLPAIQVAVEETTQEGTKTARLAFLPNAYGEYEEALKFVGLPLTGAYADQSGEKTIQLAGMEDYAAPLKMVVRWHFRAR